MKRFLMVGLVVVLAAVGCDWSGGGCGSPTAPMRCSPPPPPPPDSVARMQGGFATRDAAAAVALGVEGYARALRILEHGDGP